VERAELVEWEKAISNLLRVKKAIPPVKEPPVARQWHPSQLKLAGGVIGILLVLGLGIWIGSTSSECPKPQSSSQKPRDVVQSNHHESGQNTPGGLGPVLSQPEASNDNLLWWTCWNQQIAVNHGNTPVFPKDVNEKAEAEQPTLDKQKIDSGDGNTAQGKSGKSSLGDSVDTSTRFQNFSGEKPSNDSEEELQTSYKKFKEESKNKISNVQCMNIKSNCYGNFCENVPFFVCDVLKELESGRTVADFKSQLESKKWCESIKTFQEKSAISDISHTHEETKPVIDFFQQLATQLNKETLCPKN